MRSLLLLGAILVVVTLGVYWQVGNHEFINFDDHAYVVENPHVATGISWENTAWAFTEAYESNWHPLTWLSHMVDVQLFGMDPRGHHLASVCIHAAATLLLFLLLCRLTSAIWQSAFVAALFALHPLHVESVAWVAERKDVLSALFCFLTLMLYAEYVRRRKATLYLLSLLAFMMGLMSKPMLVTLPVIMLLLDYWPLNRYGAGEPLALQQRVPPASTAIALLKEKLPFVGCSAFSVAMTLYAQNRGGAIKSLDSIPLVLRLENAVVAYVKYIAKTFWPVDLAIYYPFPSSIPLWQSVSSLLLLLAITGVAVRARRRQPHLLVGWLWFVMTLLPVIGLVQVGFQSMADRYTYIPLVGLFIVVAWGIPPLARELPYRQGLLVLLAMLLLVMSTRLTWQQLAYWQNSIVLYRHALQLTSGNYLVHNNLGLALANEGAPDEALEEYRKALQINPRLAQVYNNIGRVFSEKGQLDEAIEAYNQAIRIDRNYAEAYNNLGNAFFVKGYLENAIEKYNRSIEINKDNAKAYNNLGMALARKNLLDKSIELYNLAIELNPYFVEAYNNSGISLSKLGLHDQAISKYLTALKIDPSYPEAHNNLGITYAEKKQYDQAIAEFEKAIFYRPGYAEARKNLGIAMQMKNKLVNP